MYQQKNKKANKGKERELPDKIKTESERKKKCSKRSKTKLSLIEIFDFKTSYFY